MIPNSQRYCKMIWKDGEETLRKLSDTIELLFIYLSIFCPNAQHASQARPHLKTLWGGMKIMHFCDWACKMCKTMSIIGNLKNTIWYQKACYLHCEIRHKKQKNIKNQMMQDCLVDEWVFGAIGVTECGVRRPLWGSWFWTRFSGRLKWEGWWPFNWGGGCTKAKEGAAMLFSIKFVLLWVQCLLWDHLFHGFLWHWSHDKILGILQGLAQMLLKIPSGSNPPLFFSPLNFQGHIL